MKKGNVKLEAAKKGNVKLVRGNFLQENEDDFEAQDLALKEENEEISLEEEENDNSEEEEEDGVSEEEELQDHLIDIPFEELQRVRSDGRESTHGKFKKETKPSRANKNRPMEVTSKKTVGRFREVFQAPKKVVRDPRFESLCGEFDENRFKKRYSFIFNEELPMERKKLQKILEKSKDPKAVEEMKKHISWIDNQLRAVQEGNKYSEKLSEHKKNEKEAVKQGKRPFYLKKSEVRKQQLIEKYKSLKANGKLEAFLAKRRQKNAAKDHRYVPYRSDMLNEAPNKRLGTRTHFLSYYRDHIRDMLNEALDKRLGTKAVDLNGVVIGRGKHVIGHRVHDMQCPHA